MTFRQQCFICVGFLLAACASHASAKYKGIVGKPLDEIVKHVQKHEEGPDAAHQRTGLVFEVYMTPLPNDDEMLSDEGIVQISEED